MQLLPKLPSEVLLLKFI